MCLFPITDGPAEIAKRDILVYKVLDHRNRSPFRYHKYAAGMHYFIKRWKSAGFRCAGIGRGYHAYDPKVVSIVHYESRHSSLIKVKHRGYVDDVTTYDALGDSLKVVKCWIPKGAKFFRGTNGDIVSDNLVTGDLKPIKILKLKN